VKTYVFTMDRGQGREPVIEEFEMPENATKEEVASVAMDILGGYVEWSCTEK